MMTIMLYGWLGQRFGRVHRRDVRSPGEAMRALAATLPGFREALVEGGYYRVLRAGREAHTYDTIHAPQSQRETLRVVPVVAGAMKDFGAIILGVALIVGAPYIASAFAFGGASLSTTLTVAKFATNLGIALVLSGVSNLLFAPPKARVGEAASANNRPSYVFSGALNTAAQGNPVPVCYGRMLVGSQVVSAGLSAEPL